MLPSANEGGVAALHDPTYQNGLLTVSADIAHERKRFNRLKGSYSRHERSIIWCHCIYRESG